MELKPIIKKRLSEQAIEQIRELIVKNKMEPGAKLPAERQLVKSLSVSRASVREALRMLEIMGLVVVKPGKGIYVKETTGDLFKSLSSWLIINKETLRSHFEARLLLEPAVAGLAAQRATDNDILAMKDRMKAFKENLSAKNIVGLIRADIEFHTVIVDSAGNKIIKLVFDTLARFSFEGWKAAIRVEGRAEKVVPEHERIIEAIARKDEKRARNLMEKHLRESIRKIESAGIENVFYGSLIEPNIDSESEKDPNLGIS